VRTLQSNASPSTPNFRPSTVWTNGVETLNPAVRNSSKAALPRSHTTQCIESRARAFQGWTPYLFTEKLWAQRYGPGGHYTYHYDWSSVTPGSGRATSFMVYVAANCTGGGTHFPRLERPVGGEWCRFVECEGDEARMDGTVFKASARNAVFWENMRGGRGFEESWHAGLPVREGEKIGLNIWSWLQEGFVPEVGGLEGEEL
jgi:prolyl 4-hydroxylase